MWRDCLIFPMICLLPVVYVFSHAQREGQDGVAVRLACAPLCAERLDASTIGRGGSTHNRPTTTACIGRSSSCSPNHKGELVIRRCMRVYTLNPTRLNRHHCLIELHRRCCVGPLRRALPPHPCHGATAVVAHYQLERGEGHSTQFPRSVPQALLPFRHGAT